MIDQKGGLKSFGRMSYQVKFVRLGLKYRIRRPRDQNLDWNRHLESLSTVWLHHDKLVLLHAVLYFGIQLVSMLTSMLVLSLT